MSGKTFYAEIYDDRNDAVISRKECPTYEDAWYEARAMMDRFRDPDNGVYPLHLQKRVTEVQE